MSNPNYPNSPNQPYQSGPQYPPVPQQGYGPQQQAYPQQPQYQQYQQQQQYPGYQPGPGYPQQPPKKKGRLWLWLGLGLAIIVILCVAASAITSHSATSSNSSNTTSNTNTTNTTSSNSSKSSSSSSNSSNSSHYKIGQPATQGDWQVSVTNVSTSMGDDIDQPKSGDQFLLVQVSVKNNSSKSQTVSSIDMFTLRDSNGQGYNETVTTQSTSSPDGSVDTGGKIAGTIAYEVPANVKSFELKFTGDLLSSDSVTFDLKA